MGYSVLYPLPTESAYTPAPTCDSTPPSLPLAVHNITRNPQLRFENLAIRSNGQILTTTTSPNASIYSVDPLGILPPTLIYTIPNVTSATGITESKHDIFYVASGDVDLNTPLTTTPSSYSITELDMRGVHVLPNGGLNMQPKIHTAAKLPRAALLNGIAMARPDSQHLLVAESFRGLIWNVDVKTGAVGVTLNDTSTKGSTPTGPTFTGINGIKVHKGTMYWTSTGASSLYRVPITASGTLVKGSKPFLVTTNLTCDDLIIDQAGNAYVAGPPNVITKVAPEGQQKVITGTMNSSSSALGGPSAVRFDRLASDRWSLYVTTNGGIDVDVPGAEGVSRIDMVRELVSCSG